MGRQRLVLHHMLPGQDESMSTSSSGRVLGFRGIPGSRLPNRFNSHRLSNTAQERQHEAVVNLEGLCLKREPHFAFQSGAWVMPLHYLGKGSDVMRWVKAALGHGPIGIHYKRCWRE